MQGDPSGAPLIWCKCKPFKVPSGPFRYLPISESMVRDAAQRLGMTKAVLTRDSIQEAVKSQTKFAASEGLSHEELSRIASSLKAAGEVLTEFLDTINALDLDGLAPPALKLAGMLNDSLERHTLSQADYLDVSNAFTIALRRKELSTHEACKEFIKKHRLLPKSGDPGLSPSTCTRIDDSTGAVWEAARQTAAKLRTIYRVKPAIEKNLIAFKVNEKSLRLNLQRLARLSGDQFRAARSMIVEHTEKLATGRTNKLFGLAKRLRKRHRMRVDGRALKRARSDKIKMLSGGHFEESGSTRHEENRVEMKEMAQRMAKTGTSSAKEALKKVNVLTSDERAKMSIMQMVPSKRPAKILEWNKKHPQDLIKARDVVKCMPIGPALDLMRISKMPDTWSVVGGWAYAQLNGVNGEATNMDDLPSWKRSREGDHYAELECEPTEEVREFIEELIYALQCHSAEQAAFSVPCVDFTENDAVEAAHVLISDMMLRRRVLEAIEIHFSQLYYCRNARFSSIGSSHGEITEGDDMPPKQKQNGKSAKGANKNTHVNKTIVNENQALRGQNDALKEVISELNTPAPPPVKHEPDLIRMYRNQKDQKKVLVWCSEVAQPDKVYPQSALRPGYLKSLEIAASGAKIAGMTTPGWERFVDVATEFMSIVMSPLFGENGANEERYAEVGLTKERNASLLSTALSCLAGAFTADPSVTSNGVDIYDDDPCPVPANDDHLRKKGILERLSEFYERVQCDFAEANEKAYFQNTSQVDKIHTEMSAKGFDIHVVVVDIVGDTAARATRLDEYGREVMTRPEDVRAPQDRLHELTTSPCICAYTSLLLRVPPRPTGIFNIIRNFRLVKRPFYFEKDVQDYVPIDLARIAMSIRMPVKFTPEDLSAAKTATLLQMARQPGVNTRFEDFLTKNNGHVVVQAFINEHAARNMSISTYLNGSPLGSR